MKALQGRKTGAASILRGCLFVLSVSALVLAGCNNGSSDGNDSGNLGSLGGKRVVNMTVQKMPTDMSFEGVPVVMKGMEVLVTFEGGSYQVLTEDNLAGFMGDGARFMTRPRAERTTTDPHQMWGNGEIKQYGTGAGQPSRVALVPPEYGLAEKYQVDYRLILVNSKKENLMECDLKIPGVLSLVDSQIAAWNMKDTYFIDDMIDITNVDMILTYNTGFGRFGDTYNFSKNGSVVNYQTKALEQWDWSLNPPQSADQFPFVKISLGNDTEDGKPGNDKRLINDKWSLKNLYMAEWLEVTSGPSQPSEFRSLDANTDAEGNFFNDYVMEYRTVKEEWFYRYLQNTVVTVHYTGTDQVKRMVAKPDGNDPMQLPLWDHFAVEASGKSTATNSFAAPKFNGPVTGIRNGRNYLVFSHENCERFQEINVDPSWVRYVEIGPIPVYVLTSEMNTSATTEITYPVTPVNARGNITKFLEQITAEGTWTYVTPGTGEEVTLTRAIKTNDSRFLVTSQNSRKGGQNADNATLTGAAGLYSVDFWGTNSGGALDVIMSYQLTDGSGLRATSVEPVPLTVGSVEE